VVTACVISEPFYLAVSPTPIESNDHPLIPVHVDEVFTTVLRFFSAIIRGVRDRYVYGNARAGEDANEQCSRGSDGEHGLDSRAEAIQCLRGSAVAFPTQ
jgi:hypothetical protein